MIGRVEPEAHVAPSRPAALCTGAGHVVVYGNPAFVAIFGRHCVGLPAREALVTLPPATFDAFDAALREGHAVARWIRVRGEDWRLVVAPRVDIGTGEIYGVSFHLRPRSDIPIRPGTAVRNG